MQGASQPPYERLFEKEDEGRVADDTAASQPLYERLLEKEDERRVADDTAAKIERVLARLSRQHRWK